MRTLILACISFALIGAESEAEAIKRLAGGKPLPAGNHAITIPDSPKQSISFLSDAEERMVGTVAMSGKATLGEATIDADAGTGTGSITIPAASLSTGVAMRDEHMRSDGWMDTTKFPTIALTDVKLTKVADTVWKVDGTWSMHGVSRPLSTYANIRLVPEIPHFGKDVVRISASFPLDLKEYGLTNPGIGTATVAQVWTVDLSLLALKK